MRNTQLIIEAARRAAPQMHPMQPVQPMNWMPVPEQDEPGTAETIIDAASGLASAYLRRERDPGPRGKPVPKTVLDPGDPRFGRTVAGGDEPFFMARGGTLRQPGQLAVVGEEGPEVAYHDGEGQTQIVPLSPRLRQQLLDAAGRKPAQPAPPAVADLSGTSALPEPQREPSMPAYGEPRRQAARFEPATPDGDEAPQQPQQPLIRQQIAEAVERRAQQPPQQQPGPETRPRVVPGVQRQQIVDADVPSRQQPDHLARLAEEYYAGTAEPKDTNGRKKSLLYGLAVGALQGASRTGDLWGALAGAGTGALAGGVDPSFDERLKNDYAQQRRKQQLADALKIEEQRADIGVKQANRDWLTQRPGIEQSKLAEKAAYNAWRMKSADRRQDTYENFLRWRMEDGDARTQTAQGRLELEREWKEFYGGHLTDRLGETKRHNRVTEGQGGERLRVAWGHLEEARKRTEKMGDGREAQRLNQAYTLVERANRLHAEADRYANWRDREGKQPAKARALEEKLRAQARNVEDRLDAQFGDLKKNESTLADWRDSHPELSDAEPWQVEEDAYAKGVKIVDYDSGGESSEAGPFTSPQAAPQYTEEDVRARARKRGWGKAKEDAAVKDARAKGLIK